MLGDMARTEKQLREKLQKNGYPQDIVLQVVGEMKDYGYIDDLQYAKDYMISQSGKKSRQAILFSLQQKGVSREILGQLEDCVSLEDQQQLIRKLIQKRGTDPRAASREELQKLFRYLLGKGFSYEEIRKALDLMEEDF